MYNPSNHIPLSKPLGPASFPIDGKYMYYTNGIGGVYAYRPFVSVSEVLTYFPVGSPFRGNPSGQSWSFEILVNNGGVLSPNGDSIIGGINNVYWFRNGVSDSDLVKKNESNAKTVISGDQSSVVSENEQGYIAVPFLSDETIWKAQYSIGEDVFQMDQSMLQSGVLYGFPDPATTNFTYKIIYI